MAAAKIIAHISAAPSIREASLQRRKLLPDFSNKADCRLYASACSLDSCRNSADNFESLPFAASLSAKFAFKASVSAFKLPFSLCISVSVFSNSSSEVFILDKVSSCA